MPYTARGKAPVKVTCGQGGAGWTWTWREGHWVMFRNVSPSLRHLPSQAPSPGVHPCPSGWGTACLLVCLGCCFLTLLFLFDGLPCSCSSQHRTVFCLYTESLCLLPSRSSVKIWSFRPFSIDHDSSSKASHNF